MFLASKSLLYRVGLQTLLIGSALSVALLYPVGQAAAEMPEIQQSLDVQAPKLLKVSGNHLNPYGTATLYFTIYVPESYGKSIEAIRISQIPSGYEPLNFNPRLSQVVMGNRVAKNTAQIPLSSIGGSNAEDPDSVTLALAEPIQPGRTVTVALTTERNPWEGGIHQFGVTAYSVGKDSTGLYLGTARVLFEDRN